MEIPEGEGEVPGEDSEDDDPILEEDLAKFLEGSEGEAERQEEDVDEEETTENTVRDDRHKNIAQPVVPQPPLEVSDEQEEDDAMNSEAYSEDLAPDLKDEDVFEPENESPLRGASRPEPAVSTPTPPPVENLVQPAPLRTVLPNAGRRPSLLQVSLFLTLK